MEGSDQLVRVLYNFEYSKDGRNVWMKEGEALNLLKKTNPDWWQVIRKNERRPFYVPAAYVEEVAYGRSGSKREKNNVVKVECNRSSISRDGKISDKNLFKEFPDSESKDSVMCSEVGKGTISEHFRTDDCEIESEELRDSEDQEEETRRLLHDKRKSWAAEELVTELTQMAIARSEPNESDYVNLKVDGERFVIAPHDEGPNSLFWQSSGFGKDVRNNPMSSSDELDNSDSLGQSNCVAWQSKYSLSSEGDKTDESMQSFQSLGNESVNSRQWRDDHTDEHGSAESSPYAQVICAGSTSLTSLETAGLKLSESLERLAQQIKFPADEPLADIETIEPIAPPREYEAPVYENIDVQAATKHDSTESLQSSSLEQSGEEAPDQIRAESDAVPEEEQEQDAEPDVGEDAVEGRKDHAAALPGRAPPRPAERTTLSVAAECKRREGDGDDKPVAAAPCPAPDFIIEGCVDVKKKIALWNSSSVTAAGGEGDDKFDEDLRATRKTLLSSSASPKVPKVRGFRGLGVVKSASESKVSALVSRHAGVGGVGGVLRPGGGYAPGSRSGSEEFLDGDNDGDNDGPEDASMPASMSSSMPTRRWQLNPEGDNLDASDSGLSNKSDEAVLDGDARATKRRRASLMRNRRVESCRRFQRMAPGLGASPPPGPTAVPPRPQSPPPPSPGQEAVRLMPAGWSEFRTADGRAFYYHAASGQRRWKPPRRRARQDSGRSASSSPLQFDDADVEDCDADPPSGQKPPGTSPGTTSSATSTPPEAAPGPLPRGWRAVMDQSGQLCYVHPHHDSKWFSSSDNKGRVYFFEENSNESSWNLPDINFSLSQEHTFDEETNQPSDNKAPLALQNEDEMGKAIKTERSGKHEKLSLRTTKSRSMVIVDAGVGKDAKNSFVSRNWPQLFDGDMCVLKEGTMHRTKITENGKKLRKNWASSHVVLTELFLLLFRDAKAFAAMKSASHGSSTSRPELCVDLNGALIEQVDRGDKASVTSRKNVFLVSTVLGLQVLFQCDCYQQAEEWYNAVHTAIHNLPSGFDSCPRIKVTKEMDRLFAESNSPEQTKKFPRISRSKSVKIKNKDGSIEDLTVSVAERQTKIRARLKKFFNRRPTMESLVKKGIWKDEPAFGCYLDQVCGNESPRVPLFVQRCISVIESSEDNMKTDGLYRASGNLSQVQKIRLQVDQNNLSALEQEEDVHVLTGALKLFFRELKEPLIPYTAFSKAIKASTIQNKKEKVAQFRDIVKSLPSPNHDTLKVLLKHLLKVTGYQEFNRMHIPNLAIVFGPTLMWPEQESLNMALDLMQQNLVIEAFLLDFESIFR